MGIRRYKINNEDAEIDEVADGDWVLWADVQAAFLPKLESIMKAAAEAGVKLKEGLEQLEENSDYSKMMDGLLSDPKKSGD